MLLLCIIRHVMTCAPPHRWIRITVLNPSRLSQEMTVRWQSQPTSSVRTILYHLYHPFRMEADSFKRPHLPSPLFYWREHPVCRSFLFKLVWKTIPTSIEILASSPSFFLEGLPWGKPYNHLFQDLSDATQGSYSYGDLHGSLHLRLKFRTLWPKKWALSPSRWTKTSLVSRRPSTRSWKPRSSPGEKRGPTVAEDGHDGRRCGCFRVECGKTLVKVVWGKFCGTSLACLAAQNSRILLWFERLRWCYLPRSGQQRGILPAELRNSLRWRGTVFGRLWCFTWIAFQTGYGSLKVQWIVRS